LVHPRRLRNEEPTKENPDGGHPEETETPAIGRVDRSSKGGNEMLQRIKTNRAGRLLAATLASGALIALSACQAIAGAYRP
jgi:hypothetical protein